MIPKPPNVTPQAQFCYENVNLAGRVHECLSRQHLRAMRDRAAQKAGVDASGTFLRIVQYHTFNEALKLRRLATPITVTADALLGTCRGRHVKYDVWAPNLVAVEANIAQRLREHPCDMGLLSLPLAAYVLALVTVGHMAGTGIGTFLSLSHQTRDFLSRTGETLALVGALPAIGLSQGGALYTASIKGLITGCGMAWGLAPIALLDAAYVAILTANAAKSQSANKMKCAGSNAVNYGASASTLQREKTLNDETLQWEPLQGVPDERWFYLQCIESDRGHGFDLWELANFFGRKSEEQWINPYTGLNIDAADRERFKNIVRCDDTATAIVLKARGQVIQKLRTSLRYLASLATGGFVTWP